MPKHCPRLSKKQRSSFSWRLPADWAARLYYVSVCQSRGQLDYIMYMCSLAVFTSDFMYKAWAIIHGLQQYCIVLQVYLSSSRMLNPKFCVN